ncbi:MAG: trehalose-phosphatase, partial [Acidimicrobiia bacterium]|nr:trehalose-phosphatase [Acidimicrobiia bacterium]
MNRALERFAANPEVLVGLDFDGVLAEIVPQPEQASPVDGVAEVLEALVGLDGVRVAAVSGRRRDDLAQRLRPPAGVILIGEHGADDGVRIDDRPPHYDEVLELLTRLAAEHEGAWVEQKQTGMTLHCRALAPETAAELTRQASAELDLLVPGTHAPGHRVVDVRLTGVTKGDAINRLRQPGEAVLYIGDDTTDESVFEILHGGDLGVKVGPGS